MSSTPTVAQWLTSNATSHNALPQHELEILAQEAWLAQLGAQAASVPRLSLGEMRMQAAQLVLTPATLARLDQWVSARRTQGVPLQHLTGFQEFLGRRYRVTPHTLIPRAETEVLVTELLRVCARTVAPVRIAEIGTGSGVIAIELLREFTHAHAVASDLSAEALKIARQNAETHLGADAARITCVQARSSRDVWQSFEGLPPFDLIVSNPPYLVEAADETTSEVVQFEPRSALFAPIEDALYFYREILGAPQALRLSGTEVWLEIPHERASSIFALALELGWQAELISDLTGRPRVLRAAKPLT